MASEQDAMQTIIDRIEALTPGIVTATEAAMIRDLTEAWAVLHDRAELQPGPSTQAY